MPGPGDHADHLRRVLRAYAEGYYESRTHLTLAKDAPDGRPVEAWGRVVWRLVLGGLRHRYGREA